MENISSILKIKIRKRHLLKLKKRKVYLEIMFDKNINFLLILMLERFLI